MTPATWLFFLYSLLLIATILTGRLAWRQIAAHRRVKKMLDLHVKSIGSKRDSLPDVSVRKIR